MATNTDKYLAFPHLSQVLKFVRDEIDSRGVSRRNEPKVPFIKVVPGYKVDKEGEQTPIFKGIRTDGEGVNPALYNFEGLYNKSIGFRPRAGVTALSVEYKNVTGAVRKGTISWTCHSLDDLQFLAKYYMHPGYLVFVEWGWGNTGSIVTQTDDNYDNLRLIDYFTKVRKKTQLSNGNYDAMLGFITNYSLKMRNDGGYDCTTELATVGDLMQGLQLSQQRDKDFTKANANDTGNVDTLRAAILKSLDVIVDSVDPKDLTNENNNDRFVYDPGKNWSQGTPREDVKDLKAPRYYSWGFVEDILITKFMTIIYDSQNTSTKLSDTGNTKYLYTVNSRDSKIGYHVNLRTTDLAKCIIVPPTVGEPWNPLQKDKDKFKFPERTVYGQLLQNHISPEVFDKEIISMSPRKLLINEDLLKSAIQRATDPLSFVSTILSEVNNACSNYWDLRLQPSSETDTNVSSSALANFAVVDLKFADMPDEDINKDIYTLRTRAFRDSNSPTSSVIKDITFTSNLGQQVALNVFYSAHRIESSNQLVGGPNVYAGLFQVDTKDTHPRDRFFPSTADLPPVPELDRSKNNKVLVSVADATMDTFEGDQVGFHQNAKVFLPLDQYGYDPKAVDETGKLIDLQYVFIYIDDVRDNMLALTRAFTSANKSPSSRDALTPMTLELEIEGIAGFRPGDMLKVDAMPTSYSNNGVFQIKGISHIVNRNAWFTKLVAAYRIINKPGSVISKTLK